MDDHGLADEHEARDYIAHGKSITKPVAGTGLAKGLAGDEMSDRPYLVIDGVDGHTHWNLEAICQKQRPTACGAWVHSCSGATAQG